MPAHFKWTLRRTAPTVFDYGTVTTEDANYFVGGSPVIDTPGTYEIELWTSDEHAENQAVYSFRINDIHDSFMPDEMATFKVDHPEWLIGE